MGCPGGNLRLMSNGDYLDLFRKLFHDNTYLFCRFPRYAGIYFVKNERRELYGLRHQGFNTEHQAAELGVARQVQGFEGQDEPSDVGVVDAGLAVRQVRDVVRRPQPDELRAAREQVVDERAQVRVVGVLAGTEPQVGDVAAGDGRPVVAEPGPVAGVEVDLVRPRPLVRRDVREVHEDRGGEPVPRDDVGVVPDDVRGRVGDRVEQVLQRRAQPGGRVRAGPARRVREAVQVGVLVGVQPQRPRDRVEDLGGHPVRGALLQPDVVGDAHARELRQLLAPQARDAAAGPVGGDPGVLGAQPGPPRLEELAEFGVARHAGEAIR